MLGLRGSTLLLCCVVLFPSIGKTTTNSFQALEKSGFVFISGGTFRLGSPEGGADSPPHVVKLSGFWLARHETTRAEYAEFLNTAPRWFEGRLPVANVTLVEAQNYCVWLGTKFDCRARLPTEDEWEAAARGGIVGARYPWGWGDPAGRACFAATAPQRVERFEPNPFGLYDMAGNVFEWCAPNGAAEKVVACGGSWAERDPRQLRVFQRAWFRRDYRGADVGFRVLIENEESGR